MPQTFDLSPAQLETFITDGFVRIDRAFPRDVADEARALLWKELGLDPDNPATWTKPVIRLGGYAHAPFVAAANTPVLHRAFDQLVGEGNWVPLRGVGTFPVRFPSQEPPGDDGWHIDTSYALPEDDPNDFFCWRANVVSRDRALLMLFLFSDVGEADAPTRIRTGSHLDMARRLEPHGDRGLSLKALAENGFEESAHRPVALATGEAGTVYLCHPLLVHAAQPHRGKVPRFMAQPPLLPRHPFQLQRGDGAYVPVEKAIRNALGLTA